MKFSLVLAALVLWGSSFGTSQESTSATHTLSKFSLGEHVSGDEIDLSQMTGKVVAIEYWGTR